MAKPIEIVVGSVGGPVAGQSTWATSQFAGLAGYLERQGEGTLQQSVYTVDQDGITLMGGAQFQADEVYFFHPTNVALVTDSGNYTNGFDYNRVMAAMVGRIGFKQVPVSPVLNSANQISRSGRYFQDFHSLVSLPNIEATMPDGSVFDAHLEGLQRAAILRILNRVFKEREYYENTMVYEREQEDADEVAGTGQFTGMEIKVAKDGKSLVQVNSVVLNFNQDVIFTLYLFKDGKKSPVWQQEVSAVAYEATVVSLDNCILGGLLPNKGNRYYLGYFQSDLGTAKALAEDGDRNRSLMFSACPFYSNATGPDFDREHISYPGDYYGFNAEISSFRDHTATIVSRPNVFDEAVGLQMAYMVIEQILYAVRSNSTERILKDEIARVGAQLELNGYAPVSDMQKVEGIAQRIDKEIARVNKSLFPNPKIQTVTIC